MVRDEERESLHTANFRLSPAQSVGFVPQGRLRYNLWKSSAAKMVADEQSQLNAWGSYGKVSRVSHGVFERRVVQPNLCATKGHSRRITFDKMVN